MNDLIAFLTTETTVPHWHELLLITIIGWSVLIHTLRGVAWGLLRLADGLERVAVARARRGEGEGAL